jgi:predicted glycogen debranching enzyme
MRTIFGQNDCQNLKSALSKEWLETNGLGSFASSTIIGANTRCQHGLLVASLKPPVERHVLVSKFEEHALVDGHECHISTNLYPGTVFPHGFNVQNEFRLRPWPTFRFATRECTLEKTVFLVHGENTLVVGYNHLEGSSPLTLKVRPLLAFREYNALMEHRDAIDMTVTQTGNTLSLQPFSKLPRLFFHTDAPVELRPDWYYKLTYPIEQERGLDYEEDLFTPFELTLRLPVGTTKYVVVSTEDKTGVSAESIVAAELKRREKFNAEKDSYRHAMTIATNAYIARRGTDRRTVLAGFPWFTDWGRDTMIALPGLTLTTKRFDDAKQILQSYAQFADRGMIPNVFPDLGETPEFNTVDAALWFVVAAWKYWKASGDNETVRQLLPTLAEVIKNYREGTRHDIFADKDSLISAGKPGTQLTWMDVKVDGYVPTPRHGKPVEINALWFNALLMVGEIEESVGRDIQSAVILQKLAERVAGSFVKTFWNEDGGYLFDVVQNGFRDPAIRPNQIFAVSLPHSPLDALQQKAVFEIVTQHLLTPYGLRTLSPKHEKYCGHYAGSRFQRDCAYHQGTVWPWLIGPYCDAYAKINGTGKTQRKEMLRLLQPLLAHLEEAGLGHVSEVFDGNAPHHPGGCFAQAWSVAELFRVYDFCTK